MPVTTVVLQVLRNYTVLTFYVQPRLVEPLLYRQLYNLLYEHSRLYNRLGEPCK